MILDVGISSIEEHVLSLGKLLVHGLENKGYRIVSPQHVGETSALTFFRGGPFSSRMLKDTLLEAGVIIQGRSKGVRVSPYFYNNADDINQLLDALP